MAKILILLLKIYKAAISPIIHLLPGSGCRFHPTCSQYTLEAVKKFGAAKGAVMGICRILRCNPFSKGGLDFVPEKFSWKTLFKQNETPPKNCVDEYAKNRHI
ncbi:MAG: membrane protein insertion efficiency factor YidD [Opitutales bacterium]|nr:membrane protein insertion efficiency factor YidD [Opitutales bacterium]